MATLITVLKGGGRYDATWVARLAAGVRRHAPAFRRILCLTDLPLDLDGVERVALRHDWPAWWAKMEAFRPGLVEGTALLCDLDTVLTGPADALAEPGPAAMEDYFHKGRVSSALLRWHGDELSPLYAAFAAEPGRWMKPGSCGPVPTPSMATRSSSITGSVARTGSPPSSSTAIRPCSTSTTRAATRMARS